MERLLSLVGLPETVCNKLIVRFDEGIIPDFVSFFRETWATALFHDRFKALSDGIAAKWDGAAELETVIAKLENPDLPAAEKAQLLLNVPTDLRATVEKELFAFLKSNNDLLPMYVPLN